MTELAGVRLTPQRRAVLDVLAASTDHPTAGEVFERVRRLLPGIGAATVYRTLGLLVESGQALELSLADGASARYDGNVERHDHVVCTECGLAVDIDSPLAAGVAGTLARSTGFTITGYDLQFHGRCATCTAADRTTR
jgi:Fe2+ or Zn2+ uptake regulation protein